MRTLASVALGKAVSKLSRFSKIGGGSAAPGLYALKLHPNLVADLSAKIPFNIVITGTNGKTTTARMLAHFANSANLKVIRNHTGSNLERGIASALIQNSRLHLRGVGTNFELGIWELDEAAFNNVAPKIKPNLVVFLNVFRDQLDRYGEIDSVVKKWSETLEKLDKNTIVLVNGDDTNTAELRSSFKGKVKTFAVKDYKILGESTEKRKTGKHNFEARNIKLKGLSGSHFDMMINNKQYTINLPLPGVYHIYDAVAAIACATYLSANSPINQFTRSLKTFSPAFGRVEKFDFGYIFLIKNPVGATQVFQTLAPEFKKEDRLLFALNDNLADGTDVSWIWDAQFEKLSTINPKLLTICSGKRAYDMANRLKYAGIDPKNLSVIEDLNMAFEAARKGLKGRLFILPTYTALIKLQDILSSLGLKKDYWKDQA